VTSATTKKDCARERRHDAENSRHLRIKWAKLVWVLAAFAQPEEVPHKEKEKQKEGNKVDKGRGDQH
jgi:hypothetical protein